MNCFYKKLLIILFVILFTKHLCSQNPFKEKNISAGKFGIGFILGIPLMSFTAKYNSEKFWFLSTQLLPGDGSGFIGRYNHYTFSFGCKLYENRYQTFAIRTSYIHLITTNWAMDDFFYRSKMIKKHTHHLSLGMQYESSISGIFNSRYSVEESPILFNIGLGYVFGKTNDYPFQNSGSYYYETGIIFYFNTEPEF